MRRLSVWALAGAVVGYAMMRWLDVAALLAVPVLLVVPDLCAWIWYRLRLPRAHYARLVVTPPWVAFWLGYLLGTAVVFAT